MIETLGEATGGYIGLMDMILREAAIRSLKKGLPKIDAAETHVTRCIRADRSWFSTRIDLLDL